MKESSWRPITPLGALADQETSVVLSRLDTIRSIWNHTKLELTADIQERFAERLKRSIAVETGIIEGLYELDRGLTQTLVMHGFARDTVDRVGESVPDLTLNMLRDHLEGLDFVMDYIGETQRDLTTGYIRELHALVTASQESSDAIDPSGRHIEMPLQHGAYKTQPNNPLLPGGGIHEYAPVEQVSAQMDELVRLFHAMESGVHPVIRAAWLHHRFVQVHPFQDGNGRVARLLASMVLVKEGYFPLHIRRDDREAYLDALEQADAGQLESFIKLLSHRLRQDLLSAVSDAAKAAAEQMPAAGADSRTRDVAALIAARRQRHRAEILERRRQVNQVAEALLPLMAGAIETRLAEAKDEFDALRVPFAWHVDSGGSHDDRGYYWQHQVVQTARRLDYWANQQENKYWIRAYLTLDEDRLRLVVSLHHYGLPVSGIMAVSAFAEILHRASTDDDADQHQSNRELVDCIDSEFTFSEDDAGPQLHRDLESWLDDALAVTLRILGVAAG